MSKVNISQAARVTGKARSTIQSHIKKGLISAENDGVGNCLIDVAELQRVYGVIKMGKLQGVAKQVTENSQDTAPTDTHLMQQKIEFLQEKLGYFEKQLEAEREEKKRLLSLVENQTRQLTDQRFDQKKKRWWFR